MVIYTGSTTTSRLLSDDVTMSDHTTTFLVVREGTNIVFLSFEGEGRPLYVVVRAGGQLDLTHREPAFATTQGRPAQGEDYLFLTEPCDGAVFYALYDRITRS